MPKHVIEIPLENNSVDEFLIFAYKACNDLGLTVNFVSESGLTAESKMSWTKNTWGETIELSIFNGFVRIKSKSKGNTLFDFGRNKKTITRLLEEIEQVRTSIRPEEYSELQQSINENKLTGDADLLNPESEAAREQKKWWSVFVPTKDFFFTPLLIDINIVLFILMVVFSGDLASILDPDTQLLLQWGANYKPLTVNGEMWRLFTCIFEHIGIIHLAMNMYALFSVGIFLEQLLGKTRFITAYFVSGISASLISLWWHDNVVSAGASGAIFGMYGVFLALLLTNIIEKETRKAMLSSIVIFIGYNLLFGMKAGVDNAAHIGGLVSGMFIGLVYYFSLQQNANKLLRIGISVSLCLLVIVSVFAVMPRIKDPVGEYLKIVEKFQVHETEALKVYNLPDSTADESIVTELKETSIPNWQKGQLELKKLNKLQLPENLQMSATLIQQYTEHRLKYCELSIHSLTEHTDRYNAELEKENKAIETILTQLGANE
ncbi:MAG: rhomboid family intramembrane serine protease [Chitinophagaceae bacterium]|nr:rhomboid family intramembrane serine protease [Chitinophagaceae bacterium]